MNELNQTAKIMTANFFMKESSDFHAKKIISKLKNNRFCSFEDAFLVCTKKLKSQEKRAMFETSLQELKQKQGFFLNALTSHDYPLIEQYGEQIVVSFSGGRTSAFLCSLIKKSYPKAKFIFCDTGAEHPNTYTFIRQCNEFFDLDLICLRALVTYKGGG